MNAKIINENTSGYEEAMEEITEEEETEGMEEITEEENPLIVKFTKPYSYEGKTYEEIDLTNIENMSGAQLCVAQRMYAKTGSVAMSPELDPNYSCIVAHLVTKLPVEFFKKITAKDLGRVKRAISGFFFNAD